MSNDRIAGFLNEASGVDFGLSEGSVYGFCARFAWKAESAVAFLAEEQAKESVLCTDATCTTTNGKRSYIRCVSSRAAVIFYAMESKTIAALEKCVSLHKVVLSGSILPAIQLRSNHFFVRNPGFIIRLVRCQGGKAQIGQLIHSFLLAGVTPDLVTVGKRQYFLWRVEAALKGIPDAVVLISYPRNALGVASALRAFVCADPSLSTMTLLNFYMKRWKIEAFFRQMKQKLALDKYQIRSAVGIQRFWILMSLAYLICSLES